MLTISVHCIETKLPTTWSSKIPKKYKSDVIIWELHRSKWKSTDFIKEKFTIKNKFKKADFQTKSINSVIKRFWYNERCKDQQDDFIIPLWRT